MKGTSWKVLIVDDEVLIRRGIKHYLDWEKEGFSIIGEAANGEEALQLIREKEPNIVITDIVMPVMDGIQLAKEMNENYPNMAVIILSSYSDFDYVRATFQYGIADYILKPKLGAEELLKALRLAVEDLADTHTVPALLSEEQHEETHQSFCNLEEVQCHLESLSTSKENIYCLVEIETPEDLTTIRRKLEEIEGVEDYFQIHLKEKRFLFLLLMESQQLPEEIAGIVGNNIWLFSEFFTDIHKITVHYEQEIEQLRSYPFYFPTQHVFTKSQFKQLDRKETFNLNYFSDLFKRQEFNLALVYLEAYIAESAVQYTKNESEFKWEIESLIFNITILLENLDFENDLHEEKYTFFDLINEAQNVDEVIHHFKNFLQKVKSEIANRQENPEQENLKKIIDYIEAHYQETITLTELANRFHFNASYLSTYFSTHQGIGLSEYLTEVRIEKAKMHLRNSRIPISEISDLVGYDNHSYFCKVFKKVTGMSPSKYRKQMV